MKVRVNCRRCLLCAACAPVCPSGIITVTPGEVCIGPGCTGCGACVGICPVGALSV